MDSTDYSGFSQLVSDRLNNKLCLQKQHGRVLLTCRWARAAVQSVRRLHYAHGRMDGIQVLSAIADASRAVEAAFGGAPQDIEGVWADGRVTIVQSRPQVV